MNTLWIVDIEPLDNRYTKQWQTHIPELAVKHLSDKYHINSISGTATGYDRPQRGAFFNFAATCEYKASQAGHIAKIFDSGAVKAGDVFFFTDAWNQTVHSVKYMSELLNIPVKIAGIWHAGWYDPTDILGMTIKNTQWVEHLEASMANAYDLNLFGTHQHLDKFRRVHAGVDNTTFAVCGYPLEYIRCLKNNVKKENIVVFPHRLNPDKAPHVFTAIRDYVYDELYRKDILFFKTQDRDLTKDGYYTSLKRCKVVFSANKHENLGIGTFEAMTAGCIPLVPNKLSYAEMYPSEFKYDCPDSIYDLDPAVISSLSLKIVHMIDNYHDLDPIRVNAVDQIQSRFFDGTVMMQLLRNM